MLELVKDIDRLSRRYLEIRSDTREDNVLGNPLEYLQNSRFSNLGIPRKTSPREHANWSLLVRFHY